MILMIFLHVTSMHELSLVKISILNIEFYIQAHKKTDNPLDLVINEIYEFIIGT